MNDAKFEQDAELVNVITVSRNQKIRLKNTMLALMGGILLSVVLVYASARQFILIGETPLILFLSVFWIISLSLVLTIYSGINTHFRDPSLSLTQMYWASTTTAFAMMITKNLDTPYYLLILLPMVFGVFRASVFQFQIFTVFVAGITLVAKIIRHQCFEDTDLFSDELISWSVFIFCALTLASICKSIVQLQMRLREKNQQLENALQARSYFLANISHELRTPMNGVIGMLELALMKSLPDALRSELQTARSSGIALLSVIDDILDFSKIEAGRMVLCPQRFQLDEVLKETLDSFAAASRHKNIHLELHQHENVPKEVFADSSRLRQILNNLLGNAIKFTHQGSVSVYVSARPNVNPEQPNEVELRFTVKDSGIGIQPENIAQLFESFTQADASTSRKYSGAGLGLPIVKQLCEIMGGAVRVESTPNQGSTFFFNIKVLTL